MRLTRVAAIAAGLSAVGPTLPASAEAASPKHDALERAVISQLNTIRAQYGVRALRASRGLGRAADAKSRSIAATGDFSHGDMSARVRRFVRAGSVGETLAYVPTSLRPDAGSLVDLWMASASHRATLLSGRFRRVGVGRRTGAVAGGPVVVFTVNLASAR